MAIFGDFFASYVFSEPRAQVSDMRLKFALRPHHVRKYDRHPICGAEIRREKKKRKKEERKKKPQGKNIMVYPIP